MESLLNPNSESAECILAAVESQNLESLKLILLERSITKYEARHPLEYAVKNGLVDCLQVLLDKLQTSDERLSQWELEDLLYWAVYEGQSGTMDVLIRAGADVNFQDPDCASVAPIHTAALNGFEDCVQLLIQHNCDLNIKMEGDSTPLMEAISEKHYGVMKQLLDAGSCVNVEDEIGQTALHWACREDGFKSGVELLINAGATLNAYDARGLTPLSLACARGLEGTVRYLTGLPNCDVNLKNGVETPLHTLAIYGHHHCISYLIEHGARPNKCDADSKTPLWHAVAGGHYEYARKLLFYCFDLDYYKCPTDGLSSLCPIQCAIDNCRTDILKMLIMISYNCSHQMECFDQPEAAACFGDETEWLLHGQQISTLQRLCRKSIRHYLRFSGPPGISQLPIPQMFRDYIAMKDLEKNESSSQVNGNSLNAVHKPE